MRVHAPPRHLVSYFDAEFGVWRLRPEEAVEWIRRTLAALRDGLFQRSAYQPDDIQVTIRHDIYRELLREIPTIPGPEGLRGQSQLFGAALGVDDRLQTWFEISWTSEEERALQSLLDSWR